MATLVSKVQSMATRAHAAVYRASSGKLAGKMGSNPILLLVTTGRKSGQRRTTPLLYLADGEKLVIVASNGGAPKHPAWFLNLKSNPQAEVQIGEQTLRVRAEEASPEEKRRLWPKLVEMYSGYENYQKKTEREIPLVILQPTGD